MCPTPRTTGTNHVPWAITALQGPCARMKTSVQLEHSIQITPPPMPLLVSLAQLVSTVRQKGYLPLLASAGSNSFVSLVQLIKEA